MSILIDGKALAAEMRQQLAERVKQFKAERGKEVGLAVVLVGEDPASQVYVRKKIRACEDVGIRSFSYRLPAETSQGEVEALVDELVASENVHGILVPLPLPKHLDERKILRRIPPAKDVDGFCAENVGNLAMKRETIVACTPFLLLNADATVTVCHSKTKNLKEVCAAADILVVAIGRAKFVTADMVKEGAVVIDVGMDRDENGKLCGDVDFAAVKDKASYITPVPGGVGPMTITMLLYNTVLAAERS